MKYRGHLYIQLIITIQCYVTEMTSNERVNGDKCSCFERPHIMHSLNLKKKYLKHDRFSIRHPSF